MADLTATTKKKKNLLAEKSGKISQVFSGMGRHALPALLARRLILGSWQSLGYVNGEKMICMTSINLSPGLKLIRGNTYWVGTLRKALCSLCYIHYLSFVPLSVRSTQ